MASGRSNKLTGQAGEFAVCAQLAKRGLIATPFAGNVPEFDVLATNDRLHTVPIQVKATIDKDSWIGVATDWSNIDFDPVTGIQIVRGPCELRNPGLVMVYVWLTRKPGKHDRYFILSKSDAQRIFVEIHTQFLLKHRGIRPMKPESYNTAIHIRHLEQFEDNWQLIKDRLIY